MSLNLPRIFGSNPKLLAEISLFLFTFPVYLATLAPGVYGFDSAELATGVFTQGITHPPGSPLYILIGKLFTFLPIGNVAYRLNLMSAVFASLTIVLLYKSIESIVENRFAAWVSSLFLGVSNYFWQMALLAEVYTPLTALLAADLLLISFWHRTGSAGHILAFSFLYGLTLTMHTSGILFAPAFACLIFAAPPLKMPRWPIIGLMLVLFAAGLTPYAYLSLRAAAHPALDYSKIYSGVDLTALSGLWWMVSGKAYSIFAFGYRWNEIPTELSRFAGYLWRNYLGIGVLLGIAGIIGLWRKRSGYAIGLLIAFVANTVFYVNYRVMDKDTMFLPAYLVWAVFIAAGFDAVDKLVYRAIALGWPKSWLEGVGKVLPVIIILLGFTLNWRWVDLSDSNGYASFAVEMMRGAMPNSVVIAPWSSAVVLEYYQVVEGQRPDLLIINRSRMRVARYYELSLLGLSRAAIMEKINSEEANLINQYIEQRTVYAVEYDPVLARKFEYLPEGPVFKLATP